MIEFPYSSSKAVFEGMKYWSSVSLLKNKLKIELLLNRNGIFPASIDPRKNISAFVASMEKSRLSEIKFIAGAR